MQGDFEVYGKAVHDLRSRPDRNWTLRDLMRRSGVAEIVLMQMESCRPASEELYERVAKAFEMSLPEFITTAYELDECRQFQLVWKHSVPSISDHQAQIVWQRYINQSHAYRKSRALIDEFQAIYDDMMFHQLLDDGEQE